MWCPFEYETGKKLARCGDDICANRFRCMKYDDGDLPSGVSQSADEEPTELEAVA